MAKILSYKAISWLNLSSFVMMEALLIKMPTLSKASTTFGIIFSVATGSERFAE